VATPHFIEISAAAAAAAAGVAAARNMTKINSSSSGSGTLGELKCTYFASVPLLKDGDKVTSLTTHMVLVNGTKVTVTKPMAELTKTMGFAVRDSNSSRKVLGECVIVSEAFGGLLPVKLEASAGSSKGKEGSNVPAQQQVTVCGDTNFTYVATFGRTNIARPLACGDYQVKASWH
jgi:hypothetical protein